MDAYFGYRVNELPRLFDQLRILFYEDVTAVADWSRREAPIVRFVAKKWRAQIASTCATASARILVELRDHNP